MRKSSHTDVATTRWQQRAQATPQGVAADALDGGSWTFQATDRRGNPFLRILVALLASLAMLATGVLPAQASTYQSCSGMLADAATTSLTKARQLVGADVARSQYGLTGSGVGVAVIDTGINRVKGLSGQGKVVDGPDLSFDALDSNLRYRDVHGHGTNIAAIIAAQGATGGDGVAPGAHLVNVKVGAGDGTVDVSQVIAAIDWVVQHRASHNIRVINLAYGTDATQSYLLDPLAHAVENAWKAGIVVVAAGGNDGRSIHRLADPAINPFIIAVGATAYNKDGNLIVPAWSSTGDGVRNPDVVAPGGSVLSAGVGGSYLADTYPSAVCADGNGNLSLRGSGTSQAAAVVAGAAALLVEQRPSLTPDQVKYLLTSTARSVQDRAAEQQGHGRIKLAGALDAPTPGLAATQTHVPSTGLGTLDAARGSFYVGANGDYLDGEVTAYDEQWSSAVWATASDAKAAWTNQTYDRKSKAWTGGTWMNATLSNSTWSGSAWSGATWSGATWSGATWSGATWSGATWSGATWSGATWSGATWA